MGTAQNEGVSSGRSSHHQTLAHLQMVQVKCCWSSLVPRLICHFWGERTGRSVRDTQPRHHYMSVQAHGTHHTRSEP